MRENGGKQCIIIARLIVRVKAFSCASLGRDITVNRTMILSFLKTLEIKDSEFF